MQYKVQTFAIIVVNVSFGLEQMPLAAKSET